ILAGEIDCGEHDRQLGGITRQVMVPSLHDRSIQQNPAYRRANELASELPGADTIYSYDMMIYKPPGPPQSTPWHPDPAHLHPPLHAAEPLRRPPAPRLHRQLPRPVEAVQPAVTCATATGAGSSLRAAKIRLGLGSRTLLHP